MSVNKEMVTRGLWIRKEKGYLERLANEITNSVTIDEASGCMLWNKSLQNNGYGQKRAFGKMMPAHRASWMAFIGSITDGFEIGHCCASRSCVNPLHLKLITHSDNMRERGIFGNDGARKIVLNGIEYRSVATAARSLGKSRSTIRYRLKKQTGGNNGFAQPV